MTGDPLLGRTVLGHYRVEKKLGQGGMGAVYLLRHERLPNTFAALKVMLGGQEGVAQSRMALRFEQEAMVAAAVGSHRVVKPIDLGQFDDGTPYIVMEFVPGRSLDEELEERGALDVATALTITGRIAETMAIAHEKGIVHRDLKPSNIMLAREGERSMVVKLLDFGVARATGEWKFAQTEEGAVIGTAGFMAPEAVAALTVDGRADVFSLGVILHLVLTGEMPFDTSNAQRAMIATLIEEAPSISSRRPARLDPVPPEVEDIVKRALIKEPSERLSMAELQEALGRALSGLLTRSQNRRGAPPVGVSFLREAPRISNDLPTLSTPSGEIASLVERLGAAGPPPAAPANRATRDEAPAPLPRPPTNRRLLFGGVALSITIGLSILTWLALAKRPAAVAVTAAPPPVAGEVPPLGARRDNAADAAKEVSAAAHATPSGGPPAAAPQPSVGTPIALPVTRPAAIPASSVAPVAKKPRARQPKANAPVAVPPSEAPGSLKDSFE